MKKGKTVSPVVAASAIIAVLVIVVMIFLAISKPKGITGEEVSKSDAAKLELKTHAMDAEVAALKSRLQMQIKAKQQGFSKMGGP